MTDELERRVAAAMERPCGHDIDYRAPNREFVHRWTSVAECVMCRPIVIAAALRATARKGFKDGINTAGCWHDVEFDGDTDFALDAGLAALEGTDAE